MKNKREPRLGRVYNFKTGASWETSGIHIGSFDLDKRRFYSLAVLDGERTRLGNTYSDIIRHIGYTPFVKVIEEYYHSVGIPINIRFTTREIDYIDIQEENSLKKWLITELAYE